MGTSLLQLIMVLSTATIVVNGFAMNADDILASATDVANSANVHQLSTALELYYSDHNVYPKVSGGTQLVNTLLTEGYIKNKPLNPAVFEYQSIGNGQDYTLSKK